MQQIEEGVQYYASYLRKKKVKSIKKKIVRAANLSPSPTLTCAFLLAPLSKFRIDFSSVKVFIPV